MRTLYTLSLAVLAVPALAQESYWIANRASNDLMEVSAWGSVLRRVDMSAVNPGGSLRSAHVAPDGKVWVVRFIQPTMDILDPATGTITSITSTSGNPFDIAFDSQGTAWVSGGPSLQQFAANGAFIQAIPLTAGAPLGITIDSAGNKWIAHRLTPPSVSRVDPAGVVTNFPLVGASLQPVRIIADFRGLLAPSHLWITGDGTSQLVEIDDLGNTLNVYPLPITSTGGVGPVFTANGDIWVGSAATGALVQIDETNGSTLNTYTFAPNILGLSVDSFGRIWATARITFSGAGAPCEVRRIDPATGNLEVPAVLTSGGFDGIGTQAPLSTPYQYSLVVAPLGDTDGDTVPNFIEIQNGTSPIDHCSNSIVGVNTTGVTSLGSTASIDVTTGGSPSFWLLAFSSGIVAPGSGITLPGFGCELLLSPVLALSGTVSGVGAGSVPVAIPIAPIFSGFEVFTQGFVAAGAVLQFTPVTGLKLW